MKILNIIKSVILTTIYTVATVTVAAGFALVAIPTVIITIWNERK